MTHQCGKSGFFRGLWPLLSASWALSFISLSSASLPCLAVPSHFGISVHISAMEQVDLRHDYMGQQQKKNETVVLLLCFEKIFSRVI